MEVVIGEIPPIERLFDCSYNAEPKELREARLQRIASYLMALGYGSADIEKIWVDGFCGAGGTTSGIVEDSKSVVWICINHDINAINSHKANHPRCLHFVEDMRTISMDKLLDAIEVARILYPNAKVYGWFSLECTNHSNAKGGVSRDADSRTLAEDLFRYLVLDFYKIYIENVREFLAWGPLEHKHKEGKPLYDRNGKPVMMPIKALKGIDYRSWEASMVAAGFFVEHRILNCADYGCPTARKRLFIQFCTSREAISWPEPTHVGRHIPIKYSLNLKKYGTSIFTRKKRPADKSIQRVMRGIEEFGPQPHVITQYSSGKNTYSLERPCPTLTAISKVYVMQPFIAKYYGNGANVVSIDLPSPTLTQKDRLSLCTTFLMDFQYNNTGRSILHVGPTLIARQDKKPLYMVTTVPGTVMIRHMDSYWMKRLKIMCWERGIGDVFMRGLDEIEMKDITTFAKDYILIGTKAERTKYIGNAVPPKMAAALTKAA